MFGLSTSIDFDIKTNRRTPFINLLLATYLSDVCVRVCSVSVFFQLLRVIRDGSSIFLCDLKFFSFLSGETMCHIYVHKSFPGYKETSKCVVSLKRCLSSLCRFWFLFSLLVSPSYPTVSQCQGLTSYQDLYVK